MARRPPISANGQSGSGNGRVADFDSIDAEVDDIFLGNQGGRPSALPGERPQGNPGEFLGSESVFNGGESVADFATDINGLGATPIRMPVRPQRLTDEDNLGTASGQSAKIALLGLTLDGISDGSEIVPRYPREDIELCAMIQELRGIIEAEGNIRLRLGFIRLMASLAEAKSAAAMLDWALEKADLTDAQRRQIIHARLLVAQAELARERDTLRQERRVEQEHLADEAARIGLVPPSELTLESLGITMTRALPPVESASGAYEVPALATLLPSVAGIDLEDSKGKALSVGAKKGFIEFLTEEAAPIVIGALIAIAFGVMIGLASPNSIRSGTVPIPMMVLLVLIGTTTACMLGRAAQGAIRNLVLALPLKERFANMIMLSVVALFFIGVFVGLGAETVIEGGALHELYSRFVGQRQALQGVVRKSAEPEVSVAVFYLMGACISLPYVIFKCNKAMQEALIGVNWARLYLVRLWDQRMSEAAMVVKSVLKVGELRREEDEVTARATAIRERLDHLANVHTAEHIIEVKAERLYAAKAWFAFLEKLDQLVEELDSDGRRPAARATAGRQVGFENVASHGANVMAALRRLFGGHSNELENRGGQ